jgi:hypothetical protein
MGDPQEIPETKEPEWKWWLRYVVVPLIGSGGIIAIVAAIIMRPVPPTHPQGASERINPSPALSPNSQPTKTVTPNAVSGSPATEKSENTTKTKHTGTIAEFYLKKRDGEIITSRGSMRNGQTAAAFWDIKNPKGDLFYGCAHTRYFVPNAGDAVQQKSSVRSGMDCYPAPCTLYCSLLEVKFNEIVNTRTIQVDVKP